VGVALTLANNADYLDSGSNSDTSIGTASALGVKARVRGALILDAVSAFDARHVVSVGGSADAAHRIGIYVYGGNAPMFQVFCYIESIGNGLSWGTAEVNSSAITSTSYYELYASHSGGSTGYVGWASGGTEQQGSSAAPSGTMPSNSANGRVRIGGRLAAIGTNGAKDRIDGVAIYSAALAAGSRYTAPSTSDSNILAFWGFDASSGANGVGGGLTLGTATAGASYTTEAGATWEHGGGGGGATGKPTHAMYYARLRAA
jgi:hypothetical protein